MEGGVLLTNRDIKIAECCFVFVIGYVLRVNQSTSFEIKIKPFFTSIRALWGVV